MSTMASTIKTKRNTPVSISLLAIVSSNEVVDAVRTKLESDSAFWFGWVKYSGYAVALGCAMEAPETFILIKRWWLLRFKDVEPEETKEDKRSWIVPLAALGLLIIVVGIIAETYCEGKVSDVDALLRAHESDKITAAEGEAAAATRESGSAATNANLAQGSARAANDAAVNAAKKAVLAGKEANKLGNELSMVQYFSTSRAVHDQKTLKEQLGPFKGQPVVFRSYKNDGDGYLTCGELVFAAQSAGMLTTNQCGEWPFPDGSIMNDGTVWPVTGLYVSGPNEDSMLALEQVLSRISPMLGAGAGPFGKNAQKPPMFIVFVGRKSDVFVGDTAQTRDAEKRTAAMKKSQNNTHNR